MAKYDVYGLASVTVYLGMYEADDEKGAIEKANVDGCANWSPSLCYQCSEKLDIGDIYEVQAEINDMQTMDGN